MKRTADINSILRPLRVTPNQAYLSTAQPSQVGF